MSFIEKTKGYSVSSNTGLDNNSDAILSNEEKINDQDIEKEINRAIYESKKEKKLLFDPSYSIYRLDLQERTFNALIKNNISEFRDFLPYKKNIRVLKCLKGVGDTAIKELDNELSKYQGYRKYSLEEAFNLWESGGDLTNLNNIQIEENFDTKIELDPFFEYNNHKYYIYSSASVVFQDNRLKNRLIENHTTFYDIIEKSSYEFLTFNGLGKKGLSEIIKLRKEILNYYRITYFNPKTMVINEVSGLDFSTAVSDYYRELNSMEKHIINSRLTWFHNNPKISTLEDMAKEYNVTGERIRQIENRIQDNINAYFRSNAELLEKKLITDLLLNEEFKIISYDQLESQNQYSYKFLSNAFSCIFGTNYGFYSIDITNHFFFYKAMPSLDQGIVNVLLQRIDVLCNKQRKTMEHYEIERFAEICLGKKYSLIPENLESYYRLIENYLKIGYGFNVSNGIIELPLNKRDYGLIVTSEFEKIKEPIHFSDLYELLCKKYPQFKRREQTVLTTLIGYEDAINVGKGLYIHVKYRPFLKGLKTTEDVIVKYLEGTQDKKARISDIIFFVKQYKDVDSGSIEFALNNSKTGKIVKINNKEFGLKEYWCII